MITPNIWKNKMYAPNHQQDYSDLPCIIIILIYHVFRYRNQLVVISIVVDSSDLSSIMSG